MKQIPNIEQITNLMIYGTIDNPFDDDEHPERRELYRFDHRKLSQFDFIDFISEPVRKTEYFKNQLGGTFMNIETLAKALHEAGREAVMNGKTVAHSKGLEKTFSFIEWDDLAEEAREGRRIQARWLDERFYIVERNLSGTTMDELEKLRMQLSACGIIALCNTPKSFATNSIDEHNPFYSDSYKNVENCVIREMELIARCEALEKTLNLYVGGIRRRGKPSKKAEEIAKDLLR